MMQQKMDHPVIRISVRNLVEFILREGDIDNRRSASMQDKDAMLLGGKIHRKIQKKMGPEYKAEVSLRYEEVMTDYTLRIEGRADGVFQEDDLIWIDEIKGILRSLDLLEQPVGVHIAQAKCYAYILASQEHLEEIGVQMTYCQMETEEIKTFRETYTMEELTEWFLHLVQEYHKWAQFEIDWKKKRNASIRNVQFPFEYRPGQKNFAVSVYKTFLRGKRLFVQAPTGVGKTIATVFPSVKAVGEGLADKIFYLTAKTITRTVAENAFAKLKQQEMQMKVITLTAKEKICFCEEAVCDPEHCPYAKGHFDRVNEAIFSMITAENEMTRPLLEDYARRFQVCPFEFALDVSLWCDAIICDYNYVFDPNARLKRYFADGQKGEYLFLIDEAHNLVERGRTMYSAQLVKEEFLEVRKLVKDRYKKLTRRLSECNDLMLEMKKECEDYAIYDSISPFYLKIMNLYLELGEFLEECEDAQLREPVADLYFKVRDFLNIYERLDENYVIYTEFAESGRFYLNLFCVNPAKSLGECMNQGIGSILFSATLLPIQYYKKLLSDQTDDYAIYVDSTFEQEKRLLVAARDVSTKYTKRSPQMYLRYAEYIKEAVEAKKGNYMIFFPSYKFMEEVYERFAAICPEVECVLQTQNMGEESREYFLNTFEEERETSLAAFCVMGGIFSEGIDLTDDRLVGALIVGTGLPQVCNEREILRGYFDEKGENGFDYAYLYPGMNKVLQSAGRVIRTEEDRGVILLLDERFFDRRCRETFPREWNDLKMSNLQTVRNQMESFWKEKGEMRNEKSSS